MDWHGKKANKGENAGNKESIHDKSRRLGTNATALDGYLEALVSGGQVG